MTRYNKDEIPTKMIDNISKIIGTGPDTIKIIKNFMNLADLNVVLEFAKENAGSRPDKTHHWTIQSENFEDTKAARVVSRYTNIMRANAEKLYGLKLDDKSSAEIFVHPENSYLDPHTDIIDYPQHDVYDLPNLFDEQQKTWPYLWSGHLSVIVYLNDDFDGGVLYFPDQGVEIKPEKNMLVAFPGNLHFLHGVTETKNAPRFTLSLWTRFLDFKNEVI